MPINRAIHQREIEKWMKPKIRLQCFCQKEKSRKARLGGTSWQYKSHDSSTKCCKQWRTQSEKSAGPPSSPLHRARPGFAAASFSLKRTVLTACTYSTTTAHSYINRIEPAEYEGRKKEREVFQWTVYIAIMWIALYSNSWAQGIAASICRGSSPYYIYGEARSGWGDTVAR